MFRNKVLVRLVLVLGIIASGTVARAGADVARLTLSSERGNYIGQGGTFDITYDTARGDVLYPRIFRRLPDGSPTDLFWSLDRPATLQNEYASVWFGTSALAIPIRPGSYPNAQRAAFARAGFAGLDVSFQNRGSNQVFGSFVIHEVTFSTDRSQILTFDAEFVQRSENAGAPALRGRFVFRSSQAVEPPVVEPPARGNVEFTVQTQFTNNTATLIYRLKNLSNAPLSSITVRGNFLGTSYTLRPSPGRVGVSVVNARLNTRSVVWSGFNLPPGATAQLALTTRLPAGSSGKNVIDIWAARFVTMGNGIIPPLLPAVRIP